MGFFGDDLEVGVGVAVGAEGNEAFAVFKIDGPEGFAVGFGDGQLINGGWFVEGEFAFFDVGGQVFEDDAAIEQEHHPMAVRFIVLFGNDSKKMEVGFSQGDADFFAGFADSALEGRFPAVHLQFASDAAPQAVVGRLFSAHQQQAPFAVPQIDEDADFKGRVGSHKPQELNQTRPGAIFFPGSGRAYGLFCASSKISID